MRTKPPHKRDATDELAGAFAWHEVTSPQGVGPPAPPPLVPAPLNVTALAYATLAAAAGSYNRTHTTHTLGEKMYQEAIDRMEVQLEAARELPSWAIALITTSSVCLGGVLLWCLALCVLAPCVWGWRRFDRDEPPPSADVELEEAEPQPAAAYKARLSDMDD